MYGSLSREQIFLSGAALGQTTNEPNDDLVWSFIKDSNDQAALSQYLRAFPSGKHRDQAQQRLAWLSPAAPDETEGARQQARLPAPTSGPDSKPAEETARSRVVLTEEDPAHPGGHRYVGFARWQTDQYQRLRGDNHADIGIRADIEIPDRNLRTQCCFAPITVLTQISATLPLSRVHQPISAWPKYLASCRNPTNRRVARRLPASRGV